MTSVPQITIVTVGYKSRDFIRQQIESILTYKGDLFIEYFLIDNASNDGVIDMVRDEFSSRFDDRFVLHAIQNEKNLGFARANNIGIRGAKGKYVILLNPDMRVQEGTLQKMYAWMEENPRAAIAGPKLVDEKGVIIPHVRRFPHVADQVAILLKIPHLVPQVLDSYLMTDFNYEQPASVDSIRGSFFMIRESTIEKIGVLDERYFIWFEEVDYCRSAKEAGLEVWYTNVTSCIDHVGRSFALVGGYQKQKFFTESMGSYFAKWEPKTAWLIFLLRPLARALAFFAEKVR